MSTKLKIIISLLFLVQGAVFYWSYADKKQARIEQMKPYEKYLGNPLSVKSMNLSNLRLKEFAIDFSQFQNLEYLDLSGNLFEEIPKKLFDLPRLKTLNLSHNRLSGSLDVFSNLSIERLDLSNNSLTEIYYLECSINCFKALKTINLNNNNFSACPLFKGINLDTILLKNNSLESIVNIQLNLPNSTADIIEHLDISNNNFGERTYKDYNLPGFGYHDLSELAEKCVSLDMSENYFERFPYEIFGNYELKHLKMNNCQIDDNKIIITTNNLVSLDISKNQGKILGNIFNSSFNLKKLNLESVLVVSFKLRNKTLEELYIEQINTIYELDFPNLKTINVDVYNSGIKQLINSKLTLPKLEKIILRNYIVDDNIALNKLTNTFPNAEITIESFMVAETEGIIEEELLEEN